MDTITNHFSSEKAMLILCILLSWYPHDDIKVWQGEETGDYMVRSGYKLLLQRMSFTPPPPPPVFARENYHIWVVKMKTYLQAHDLWSVVENDTEPTLLRANPTIAQILQHSEECAKKYKAMACLQNGVSDVIFTQIMTCDSPK
ncbi:hypothetical protein CXB51_028733 [Gossypium anomalum]|uniref:DUF4219 domain-containing protein n=1 Tax=Gossypium anomalum TaxID=47600 RepID=A0A8J5YF62_9ROSI|nr:hypothetical protein CXB51_028733 [Gossypium anomalum]